MRATGASAAHNGFSAHAAKRKTTIALSTAAHAWPIVRRPVGSSRPCVRGLRASRSRSAMRLNPIATNRAAVNATTTRPNVRQVTVYARDAATTPSSANGNAKTVCGRRTKLTYRTSSDSPANVWPSRLEINPQLLPHRIHGPLRLLVHHDLVGPLAREPLFFPFAGGVDPHLRSEGEAAARMVEHVDRAHSEPHVALGVDVVQRDPPRLLRIAYVHVLVDHH